MKLIQPSVEFYGEVPTEYDAAIAFIEKCGRLCYQSESKGEPKKFVRKLIEAEHLAMVEHSNFVVRLPWDGCCSIAELYCDIDSKYINIHVSNGYIHVGGNLTAWWNDATTEPVFFPFVDAYGELFSGSKGNGVESWRWEICPHNEIPKELHRYSAKFTCNRAVSHELVRHRPCSFAQVSQRYVRYDGDMEFIEPEWWRNRKYTEETFFRRSCVTAESAYKWLLTDLTPQRARAVLPNAIKTEIIVTADAAEWEHIRALRTAKDADPEMQRVMNMMPWAEII